MVHGKMWSFWKVDLCHATGPVNCHITGLALYFLNRAPSTMYTYFDVCLCFILNQRKLMRLTNQSFLDVSLPV